MERLLKKDLFKRKKIKVYEFKKLVLKALIYNQKLTGKQRARVQRLLSSLPRNTSITRIKNRCFITGRRRGVYSTLRVSRIKVRELILNGTFSGYRKASW